MAYELFQLITEKHKSEATDKTLYQSIPYYILYVHCIDLLMWSQKN